MYRTENPGGRGSARRVRRAGTPRPLAADGRRNGRVLEGDIPGLGTITTTLSVFPTESGERRKASGPPPLENAKAGADEPDAMDAAAGPAPCLADALDAGSPVIIVSRAVPRSDPRVSRPGSERPLEEGSVHPGFVGGLTIPVARPRITVS